jgi:putative ABC transport system permease protein
MLFAQNYVTLLIAYVLLQFASNIAHGPYQSYIPELVPEHKRGQVTGVKQLFEMVGLIITSLAVGNWVDAGQIGLAFGAIIFFLLFTMALTALFVSEEPYAGATPGKKPAAARGSLWQTLFCSRDFFLWLVARLLTLVGANLVRNYILLFLKDVLKVPNPAAEAGSIMAVIGVAIALIVYPAGALSDRFGRKGMVIAAGVLGAIGAVIGIGLGILLGRLTVGLVTQTINDLYFSVTVRGVEVDALSIVKGIALGISAAVIAAALPAAEAASVPAVTVLQRSDLEARVRRWLPMVSAIGVVCIATGAAAVWLSDNAVPISFAGIFVGLFGVTLGVPALTTLFMRIATRTLGRIGLLGRMAARTVTQALSRTSVAIAALMIAVSVVIGVTVMIESFRATVQNWLAQTLVADTYITPPIIGANRTSSLEPALIEKVRAVQGIGRMDVIRDVNVYAPAFGDVRLIAASSARNRVIKSSRAANVLESWQRGSVMVSEPFANRHRLREGEDITLTTPHGAQKFQIVGIFFDYSSDQGIVLMSLDVYRRFWNDPSVSAIGVYTAPNANADQVEEAIRRALGGENIVVQSNQALRDAALVIFDRTFAITATLRLIAVVVAFIGVLSALMALQLERTRELGTLRATGMTLRQLWRLTLLESGLMGATAGVLATPTGLLLSAILIYVINLRSFGWTIFFEPVPAVYVEAFAVSVIAALLAAVYPMLRLGRLQVAEALREE